MKITVFSDGGSRGNPGPAAIGCIIKPQNFKISKCIGVATNNQAEYKAVIAALEWMVENREEKIEDRDLEIEFFLDSKLVVEQLNQKYKLKNEGLKPLFWQIRSLILELSCPIIFKHIPREQNQEADKLVNEALDRQA